MERPSAPPEIRPWYREPWPWVAIAIPAAGVIMGAVTLYLALANPDYLVVEEQDYQQIRAELRVQPVAERHSDERESPPDRDDGDY